MIPRPMARDELPLVLEWAAREGWNPGLEDAKAFYDTDPQGFFVGELDGAPVAAISVVSHSEDFAFLGLYLCLPENRGKGYGYALWQHAMAHAGDRVTGLDGVPTQQANYRKSGFVLADQTWRYEGRAAARHDPRVRRAEAGDLPGLIAMETAANGYAKPAFLGGWLRSGETRQTLVFADGSGFATYRRCGEGYKIGPLVAATPEDAAALIEHIAAAVPERLIIDVPESCVGLTRYCQQQGMSAAFNTARMYRGTAPRPGPHQRAVATLELG